MTAIRDARVAIQAGADFLGLVFYEKSPRYISPKRAADLLAGLRQEFPAEQVRPVGVFVRAATDEVWAIASYLGLSAIQLHGDEEIDYVRSVVGAGRVIRAVRVKDKESLDGLEEFQDCATAFLFDSHSPGSPGGTGQTFAHELARPWIARHPVLIAGGLRPETVAGVVRTLRPYGVDVSSGVETSPGIKDAGKVRAFLDAVRQADREKLGPGGLPDPDIDLTDHTT